MVAKEREKESGVLPRGKSLKDKASDVINYFLRVKHDEFIEFFQILFFFFFYLTTVKIVRSSRPLHLTSIILVEKKGYLSINFKKRLRKLKTANANEHAIPASSSSSSSIRSILYHLSTSKRETVFR